LAKALASAASAVIVGVSEALLLDRESLMGTTVSALSRGKVVSGELLMPIPAAMNPPSPPAIEEVLAVSCASRSVWSERFRELLGGFRTGDVHDIVMLLVVLLVATLGAVVRHKTDSRMRANA
jgi:hypothetical protein